MKIKLKLMSLSTLAQAGTYVYSVPSSRPFRSSVYHWEVFLDLL